MSSLNFPAIETVLGIIDDQKKLPVKGKVGKTNTRKGEHIPFSRIS